MDTMNFQVGETFPLPINTPGDGGMFQADANGIMFILQLSNADVIAVEAFRTGKMELALYEEDGVLFFLYQIDGIFKEGWGDAPFSPVLLKTELKPTEQSLTDNVIHLYLVDSRLKVLLAMRRVTLNDEFMNIIRQYSLNNKETSVTDFSRKVQAIWKKLTPAAMRQKAVAVEAVALDIPKSKLH